VGLTSYKAGTEEKPAGNEYYIDPTNPEYIWIQRLADLNPQISWIRGIKKVSAGAVLAALQGYEFSGESKVYAELLQKQLELSREPKVSLTSKYLYTNSYARGIPWVTNARLNPLLAEREGDFSDRGHHGSLSAGVKGSPYSWVSFNFEPTLLLSSESLGTEKKIDAYVKRAYLKFNAQKLEIELGADTVRWGQGESGSMLLSGNTRPYYLFRVANSHPVLLPGFLKHLGPTRTDFFLTFLDSNRTFPYSILQGIKTSFKPHKRFEFGLGQVIQFGGEGRGSWSPLNYFSDELTGSGNGKVNRGFITELRWRIPKLELETYVEGYWEDCCDPVLINKRDILQLAGVAIPRFAGSEKSDLSLEWARTNAIAYAGSYPSGLYYRGQSIGHSIGTNGNGVYLTHRYFVSPKQWTKLSTAYERRTDGNLVHEKRYRLQMEYHQEWFDRLNWALQAGYERVNQFNFLPGDRNNYLLGLTLGFST